MSDRESEIWRPRVPPEAAPFFEATLRGELVVQQCVDTERLLFPPRLTSPWGERRAPRWVRVSGRGQIWSFVVAHPPLLPPFDERAPYVVLLVALEEDPRVRLVGNLAAGVVAPPAAREIGAAVEVCFEGRGPEMQLPAWRLSGATY